MKYDIKEWNSVLPGENTFSNPMIYIKPDKDFEKYANENNNLVLVSISGSESEYDNKETVASVSSSGLFPDYRPNFYNKHGYFNLVLFCGWLGYPPKKGTVEIRGLKGPDKITLTKPSFMVPKPFPWPTEMYTPKEEKCRKLTTNQLCYILISFFILFCILISLTKTRV